MLMKLQTWVTVVSLLIGVLIAAVAPALAGGGEQYLHLKVQNGAKGESVNVNVPLSMAEKIIPAINNERLHDGCVKIRQADVNGIDVRTILDAVRTAPDNEFVTVREKDQSVRVAKRNGNIIVYVRNRENKDQRVDVTVPMRVVNALFSTSKRDQLDVVAALRALGNSGSVFLVTVQDASQSVRVWVDSQSTAD
jgi:hypothetical protein